MAPPLAKTPMKMKVMAARLQHLALREVAAAAPRRAGSPEADRLAASPPSDLTAQFRTASILRDGRAVFNIDGNKYRIVVWVNYPYRIVYIRSIGTHKQYDAIDSQSI